MCPLFLGIFVHSMQSDKVISNSNQELFKNIQKGLKYCTVGELNEAILNLLEDKSDKKDEKEYILTIVCSHFGISKRALMKSKHRNGIMEARHLAFCLLHLELGMSTRHIASGVFDYQSHSRVAEAIRRYKSLDPVIKVDREFQEKYKNLQFKLITFINDKKNN